MKKQAIENKRNIPDKIAKLVFIFCPFCYHFSIGSSGCENRNTIALSIVAAIKYIVSRSERLGNANRHPMLNINMISPNFSKKLILFFSFSFLVSTNVLAYVVA
jgi:hypothetical protein